MDDKTVSVPKVSQFIDGFIRYIGKVTCWLNSILVINILIQVILRYALGEGKIWLEELQWHFYGICLMLAIPYCIVDDAHVRLDILHRNFSIRKKEFVEFFGTIFLILPLIIVLFLHGLDFVESAIRVNETSPHPLGLPWRWFIKSFIPMGMFLIVLASFSRMVRAAAVIFFGNKDMGK